MNINYSTDIERILEKRFKKKSLKFSSFIDKELIAQNLHGKNDFIFEKLYSKKIFHIAEIKKICVDYRLRFLDSSFFKGKIPNIALEKIDVLQKEHQTNLCDFKIMGPSSIFQLKKKDDPLLFVKISKNYYYLIHKWGNDLSAIRRVIVWPYKNLKTLLLTLFILSFLITKLIPAGLFSKTMDFKSFWIIHLFVLKGLISVVLFYGFALGKSFNSSIWNNQFDKF